MQNTPPPFPTTTNPAFRLFSTEGRLSRLSYLGWNFLINIVFYVIIIAMAIFTGFATAFYNQLSSQQNILSTASFGAFYLGFIAIMLTFFFINLFIIIKRFHDFNLNGWCVLLFFVPLVNFIVMLMLLFVPGTKGINRFGAPRASESWEKVLAWINIILIVLFIGLYAMIIGTLMDNPSIPSLEVMPKENTTVL
ncbi:DUF805 domain-containing protein [Acinetobacter qingfengensis]|uniref:Uncharacterized protein n=1 Tax=Acinetobacter qingfengensis TaxID=1262585 RepID=A0A1E7QWU4_9GAMM|nr:DUF805 domain-containing protein [Acinetobacter qingfengensis]KAA8731306.1 DUF805 domain-containing protein [Acinetobacter qingfengensis]OEY91446.1 hypothetical protein BJI46_06840 [Acinetobacter qingfengensis]